LLYHFLFIVENFKVKKIILRNKGGIGNQLFMYCTALTIAKNLNSKLYVDNTTGFRNDFYRRRPNIQYIVNDKIVEANLYHKFLVSIKKIIPNKLFNKIGINIIEDNAVHSLVDINYTKLKVFRKIIIEGYFQSYTYFEDIESIIQNFFQSFTLQEFYINYHIDIIKLNSVSIHVRRIQYDDILDLSYYKNAIDYINAHANNLHFFIFSDDIQWCIKEFSHLNCTFIITESPKEIDELYLMSRCKHHIIANSSFSWWGAWILKNTEKIIIAPTNTQIGVSHFFYPKNWIVI